MCLCVCVYVCDDDDDDDVYAEPRRLGRVTHNFTAKHDNELSARAGDVVVLLSDVDENWINVKLGAQTGGFQNEPLCSVFLLTYRSCVFCRVPFERSHVSIQYRCLKPESAIRSS